MSYYQEELWSVGYDLDLVLKKPMQSQWATKTNQKSYTSQFWVSLLLNPECPGFSPEYPEV